MLDFFKSTLCYSRKHCVECRTDRKFKDGVVALFDNIDDPSFECPYNISKGNIGKKLDAGEIKYPPMVVQLSNACKAIARTAIASASGEKVRVSSEVLKLRMNICKECDFYDISKNKCKKCGCKVKYKARLMTEHCPIDTW